jgi:hypothetical protein
VLVTRKTDVMAADVLDRATVLAKEADDRAAGLRRISLSDDATMAEAQAAAEALEAWVAAHSLALAERQKLEVSLAAVEKRRGALPRSHEWWGTPPVVPHAMPHPHDARPHPHA